MSTKPNWYNKPKDVHSIIEALDDVQVHGPGQWENELSSLMEEWYAVSVGYDGIVAYFADESDACSFRLKIIDRWFNG